jgi:hypothetical protein
VGAKNIHFFWGGVSSSGSLTPNFDLNSKIQNKRLKLKNVRLEGGGG